MHRPLSLWLMSRKMEAEVVYELFSIYKCLATAYRVTSLVLLESLRIQLALLGLLAKPAYAHCRKHVHVRHVCKIS